MRQRHCGQERSQRTLRTSQDGPEAEELAERARDAEEVDERTRVAPVEEARGQLNRVCSLRQDLPAPPAHRSRRGPEERKGGAQQRGETHQYRPPMTSPDGPPPAVKMTPSMTRPTIVMTLMPANQNCRLRRRRKRQFAERERA